MVNQPPYQLVGHNRHCLRPEAMWTQKKKNYTTLKVMLCARIPSRNALHANNFFLQAQRHGISKLHTKTRKKNNKGISYVKHGLVMNYRMFCFPEMVVN